MKETLRTSAGPPLARVLGAPVGPPASGITLGPAVAQPPQLLRRPESKGARLVEEDPQEEETGGAPPTGPPEMVTTGPLRNKSRVKPHTRECKQLGVQASPPTVTQLLWRRPELVPGSSVAPSYGGAFP